MKINEVNLKFGSLNYTNNPLEIILHHADAINCSIEDINSWHKANGWSGVGYHYLVRKDGSVWKGRPDNCIGAHCLNKNTGTLGICFEGNFEKETMNNVQLQAGAELIKYLKDKYGITNVSRHKDYMATDCPGKNFPFSNMIKGNLQPSTINSKPIKNNMINNISTHLRDFQKAYNDTYRKNILVDGIFGSQTEEALKNTIVKKGQNNSLVAWLQCRIGAAIDGKFGANTDSKLREFQKNNGLSVDGIAGYNTFKKLLEKFNW